MKIFVFLLFAASTLAVQLNIKPFKRLIPADVLRGKDQYLLFPFLFSNILRFNSFIGIGRFVQKLPASPSGVYCLRRPVCSYLKVKVPLCWKHLNYLLSSLYYQVWSPFDFQNYCVILV